jgi:hypothetical protein
MDHSVIVIEGYKQSITKTVLRIFFVKSNKRIKQNERVDLGKVVKQNIGN